MNNPYTNRGTIKNPYEFYGREREIRRIFSRISSSHPQCISVIGERKIGKSSLLYYLNHESIRKKWLKDPDSYIFLLIDLQERTFDISFTNLFQYIFRYLKKELGDRLAMEFPSDTENHSEQYEAFRQVISKIVGYGLKLIIMFDEFGMITTNESFDSNFFSFLRSIANNYDCAYITTSRMKLQELCHDTDISESPFFNIFTPVPLSQFSHDEARSLIFMPSKGTDVEFSERDADFIISNAGYHPLFIQIACSSLFDHRVHNSDAKNVDYEIVKKDFLVEATGHFENIWKETNEAKQEILCKAALGEGVTSQEQYLVKELQRSGYLTEDRAKPFSQSFQEFLLSKRPGAAPEKTDDGLGRRNSFSEFIKDLFSRKDR